MVTAGNLPQLLGGMEAGEYVLPTGVVDTLRDLKKRPTDTPNQIAPSAYKFYESVPRLDKKAFRYAVRGNKMFFMEGVESMGGLITDTVMTELGEFTAGDNAEPDFTEIIKIKSAKKRQRDRQLHENEQVAARSLSAVRKIAKESVSEKTRAALDAAGAETEGAKRFVRLGKPDYKQAQMEIISRHAEGTELEQVCAEHKNKIDAKNQKWESAKLRLPKKVENANERRGTEAPETIGKTDPKRRTDFDAFYSEKSPKIAPYLLSEEEIVSATEVSPDQFVVVERDETKLDKIDKAEKNKESKENKESEDAARKKHAAPRVIYREVPLKMAQPPQPQIEEGKKEL